jgi:pimeloyl-ACP methyl ester carboxylesterase
MATFVLVHGSWAGGWNWARLRPFLADSGHHVLTPTLSGLGDRGHLAGPDIGLSTHIKDITRLLDWEDLTDVVLVGHSYGGMVVTGVLGRVPERLARVVYLDAFRPEPGQAAFDVLPELPGLFGEPPAEHPWGWPPVDLALLGIVEPADRDWMARKCTPMPVLTHREPLPAPQKQADVPITYLRGAAVPFFADTADKAEADGATVISWPDAAHYLQVHHAARTAELLLGLEEVAGDGGSG